MLIHLPQNLGNLHSLSIFTLSKNQLLYLPGSIAHLNLTYLIVEDNQFFSSDNRLLQVFNIPHGWQVLSLLECSARLILNSRFVAFYYLYSIVCVTFVFNICNDNMCHIYV